MHVHQLRAHAVRLPRLAHQGDHLAALPHHGGVHGRLAAEHGLLPVDGRDVQHGRAADEPGLLAACLVAQLPDDQLRQMRGDVAEVRRAADLEHRRHDGLSLRVGQPLAAHDDHAALLPDQRLHIGEERLLVERALRQIDEVRAIHARLPRQRRGRGDPAGVASAGFDDHDVNRQARDIGGDLRDALGDVARRAGKAGRVVGHSDVVVHRLGDAHHAHVHGAAGLVDLAAGVHGAVAAVEQHIADAVAREDFGHARVILRLQRVAGGADGAAGRGQQQLKLLLRGVGDVLHVPAQQAARAADRGVDAPDVALPLGLSDRAVERGVDDRRRPAAMDENQVAFHVHRPFRVDDFILIIHRFAPCAQGEKPSYRASAHTGRCAKRNFITNPSPALEFIGYVCYNSNEFCGQAVPVRPDEEEKTYAQG